MAPKKRAKRATKPLAFLDAHPFVRQTVVDKIHGCIIGSALGDTIGLYTEFLTKGESAEIYPDRKFQLIEPATQLYPDGHRTRFASCAWTDDTDQALLIVLGYLHNSTATPSTLEVDHLSQDFAARLRIWISQGLLALNRHACGIGALVGSIVRSKNYLRDPVGVATREWVESGRWLAPNGSLMRTHPIGIIGVGMSEEKTWELSVGVGRTTHVDPRCVVSCCIEVALIRGLLRGDVLDEGDLDACIERSYKWVKDQPELMNPGLDEELTLSKVEKLLDREEFDRHVYAESLEELELDEESKIGYVYKCLGSAIILLRLAMRKANVLSAAGGPLTVETLFEDLIVDLIMEAGDADTNAAAAGALVGAFLGYASLPSHWTLGLAHREWLLYKTGRLAVTAGVIRESLQLEEDEASDGGVGLISRKDLDRRWSSFMAEQSKKAEGTKDGPGQAKKRRKI